MPTIHLTRTIRVTPEQFVAAVTDFGPGRSKIFGNTSDEVLEVHGLGETTADVTEGTKAGWERLHYDWLNPHRVTMTTVDSNLWGGSSGHTYELVPQGDGTTRLDVTIVREGKNVAGRLAGLLVGSIAKGALGKAVSNTVTAIEQRYGVRS
ncbi:SRPBCC family protein [Actinoplanes friuliensis]|uniref:Polyketide cyclase/dehydrase n=1 Tax=Actinoplanes friuliensis DSM 7358 TaxID=1246995 RepID=U5VYP8_9ACTN|nr:SRPBCC family protein [Actinoplanes friuliensis]AGZ40850.1 hypothetical protein AFR_12820 [Actinoplanes friuliensis DSM 7358]